MPNSVSDTYPYFNLIESNQADVPDHMDTGWRRIQRESGLNPNGYGYGYRKRCREVYPCYIDKNNPEANKSGFQFGWFHTGDIGFLDEDGYLHLVGRIKELINRGGEKISPNEVDAVLLSHSDIAQAVSFGVPDDKYGEEIHCAVIPREGSNLTEEDVLKFCKNNLATFKVPKKVFLTDSVPKTATGKIQRRIVAEHFLTQISPANVPKFGA